MIETFWDKDTQTISSGKAIKKPRIDLQEKAKEIMAALNAIDDLRALYALGYKVEKKKGKIKGLKGYPNSWYSIEVNRQYRIVFAWYKGKANNVVFLDYH